MSRKGNFWDNVPIESFFGTLKTELVHQREYPDRDAARGAEAVRDAITRTITTLPEQLRQSLTWDQGAEMSQHARPRIDAGLQVYFCDSYSPRQRGTNKNTN